MKKMEWKAGNMLAPLPAVMVSCGTTPADYNIITIAWTGTICSKPPMCYVSVRPERHSYALIKEANGFVINLTTADLAFATDWCGVKSGREEQKFEAMELTPLEARYVKAPMIAESPVNIECAVQQIVTLGSHDMFVAEVVAVHASEEYINPKTGKFDLERSRPIAYSHGRYYELGKFVGRFGFSVMKKKTKKRISREIQQKNES